MIQTRGVNLSLVPGVNGQVLLGSDTCTSDSLCAQPGLVAQLTAQLSQTNRLVQQLSSTIVGKLALP